MGIFHIAPKLLGIAIHWVRDSQNKKGRFLDFLKHLLKISQFIFLGLYIFSNFFSYVYLSVL